ncbi:MAG: hypothetical protein KGJ59_07810 [Bacteroidota bacterium]|nr:hypothetical protein [Bacteroidota bacterium]
MKRTYLFILLALALAGCDKGIAPNPNAKTGFNGSVYFMDAPADTIFDLRVVAVPYYPIDTSVNTLITKVLNGIIPFTPSSLPTVVDSGFVATYELDVPAKEYDYVAVVQRFGGNYFHDWRVLSFYGFDATSPVPKTVAVHDGEFLTKIDMTVDFHHLPPQPFAE